MKIAHVCVINYCLWAVSCGWTLRHHTRSDPLNITVGVNTIQVVNDVPQQTKTLIFYTLKGDKRQLQSLCFNAKLLERTGVPDVLKQADILVYDNGGPNDPYEQKDILPSKTRKMMANECLSVFDVKSKKSYMTSKYISYRMGAVQALDAMLNGGFLENYKWVVHLQPDVFVIDPRPLATAMQGELSSAISGKDSKSDIILRGPNADKCLTFGFFAFRPSQVRRNAFSNWKIYDGRPECYLADEAFKDASPLIVPHDSDKHFINQGIDRFGLWHQHNVTVIESYYSDHPNCC